MNIWIEIWAWLLVIAIFAYTYYDIRMNRAQRRLNEAIVDVLKDLNKRVAELEDSKKP